MPDIDAKTYNTIKTLCHQCDKLRRLGDYDRAVSKYYEAITMLPRPVRAHKLAPWLYTALGETYWTMNDFVEAGKAFGEAYCCPGCKDNAQIILRLGQCFAECGEEQLALEYLGRVVELGGAELFDDEDRKYYYILHPEERPQPEPEPEPVPEPEPEPEIIQYAAAATAAMSDPEVPPAEGDFSAIIGAVLAYPGEREPDSAEDPLAAEYTYTEDSALPASGRNLSEPAEGGQYFQRGKPAADTPAIDVSPVVGASDSDLITVVQDFDNIGDAPEPARLGQGGVTAPAAPAPELAADKPKESFFKKLFGGLFKKKG